MPLCFLFSGAYFRRQLGHSGFTSIGIPKISKKRTNTDKKDEFRMDMGLFEKLKDEVRVVSTYGTKFKLRLNGSLGPSRGYTLKRLEGTSFSHLNSLYIHSYYILLV